MCRSETLTDIQLTALYLGKVGLPEQSTREKSDDILARLFVYVN